MKKFLSLSLTAALLLSLLAGCGGGETQSPAPADSQSPAVSVPAEEPGTAAIDPLTIKFSSTFNENDSGGAILKYFVEQLDEISGGAIQVDVAWGGTLFPSTDELDALIEGAIDMIALGHMPHLNTLTYLAFPGFHPDGTQAALDYFNALMFEDPETSAIIQGQANELGIKYLNVLASGANAFCSKNPFTDLDSLVAGSSAFANFNAALYEALGFQVTVLPPPDIYDALNRGLVDASMLGFDPMVSMSWYEVAPYWALGATYGAGNFFTANLEWWDTLTAAQQEAILEAAKRTEDYSGHVYDESISANVAKVEEATGNKFVQFDQEDLDKIWAATFDANADSALRLVSGDDAATADQMVILEKAAELTGYDWQH